jgi:hypothetical protein
MTDAERLQRICDWAADRGYHVELDPAPHEADEVDPVSKVIVISPSQSPRQRVYAALHEAGHILGYEAKEFLFSDAECRITPRMSARARLAVVETELDAWRRGWRLAERLGLGLSERGFEREAAVWLMTYVKGAAGLAKSDGA